MLGGVAQPGLKRPCQPQIDRQVNEVEPILAAERGGLVAAAVVDHHIIVLGVVFYQIPDHRHDAGFLVMGGDNNQ